MYPVSNDKAKRDIRGGCRMFGQLAEDLKTIHRIQRLWKRLNPAGTQEDWRKSAAIKYLDRKLERRER